MPRIAPSTLSFTLINIALIGFLSAPFLTHATSEPKKTQAPTTPTQATSSSSNRVTSQDAIQAKNSILSLKTGRNLLKAADLAFHLFLLKNGGDLDHLRQKTIYAGLIGTSAALSESIVKDYETPRKQNNSSIRSNTFILCKLIGIIGHALLTHKAVQKSETASIFFMLPNLAFLGHSLYGNYKSYVATKENSNTQSAPSNDKIASTNKNSQPAS